MPNEDRKPLSPADDPSRRYRLVAAALLALVVIGAVVMLFARGNDRTAATPLSSTLRSQATPAPSSTTLSTKSEVVLRLQEILDIRERAFQERDASLFEDVYASDCPCLRAGRDAITALKKEKVLWKNRSITIRVQTVKSLSKRLLEIDALFFSKPFRIETEEGRLVRKAPAERARYRFLLVRASDVESWRLGSASLVEGS